jgi:Papain family cysteine protease
MARPRRVKRILNCLPSQDQEQDWLVEHAKDAGVMAAAPPVPAAKDLRQAWWKISDQGSTGSCVGWASADGVLRWHFVKAGRLAKTERVAPRFQWMAAKETDAFTQQPTTFIDSDGTSLKAALDIARRYGAVRETVLPFDSGKLYGGDVKSFYALAAQLKINAYFNLGTDLVAWKAWLATNGPILTRLGVDATWDDAPKTKGNLDLYKPKTVRGGHAVALVGYTADRFIVRNSWGTGWGDKGFAYASSAYAQAAFTEAYGVALM